MPVFPTTKDVESALSRACAALAGYQEVSGRFHGEIDGGTAATSQTVIVECFLGVADPVETAEVVRWLKGHVQQDGSVRPYPFAKHTSLDDACCMYAAFVAAGVPESDPPRVRLRAFIDRSGGYSAANPITQIFLVMASVLPASSLQNGYLEHLLIPGIDRYVGRTFIVFDGVTCFFLLPGLMYGLKKRSAGSRASFLDRKLEQRLIDYLLLRQNPDGNWAGSQWVTTLALACLFALGIPTSHDAIVRGLAGLSRLKRKADSGLQVIAVNADVWNTAIALHVLTRAGYFPTANPTAAARAVAYLLSEQSAVTMPDDWSGAKPEAPRTGGFAFEAGNPYVVDNDTTGLVLMALRPYAANDDRIKRAMHRAQSWLLSMQNDSGGFASFCRNQRTAPKGAYFSKPLPMPQGLIDMVRFVIAPPFEFVDTPTADLTGRLLIALGSLGYDHGRPQIQAALGYLYSQQDRGRWWGRWTTNYLAATAYVLRGLVAVGESPHSAALRAAINWTLAQQNADGGFGEANESYADPQQIGKGPSNAYLTAIVLQALCAAGEGRGDGAARAAQFLITTQRKDGLWDEIQAVQSMAPPDLFYMNFVNFETAPVEALVMYKDAQAAVAPGR